MSARKNLAALESDLVLDGGQDGEAQQDGERGLLQGNVLVVGNEVLRFQRGVALGVPDLSEPTKGFYDGFVASRTAEKVYVSVAGNDVPLGYEPGDHRGEVVARRAVDGSRGIEHVRPFAEEARRVDGHVVEALLGEC